MSAIANCLISAGTAAVLLHRCARWGVMSGLAIFASFSHAVTFEVTTAEEFQAALATAASNGGDDEIRLAEGVYKGNFKFVPEESFALTITGTVPGRTILDGGDKAYVFFLSAKNFAPKLNLNGLYIRSRSSVEGALLRITSNYGSASGWQEGVVPAVTISDADLIGDENADALFAPGVFVRSADVVLERVNYFGASINCEGCSLSIQKSEITIPKGNIKVGSGYVIESEVEALEIELNNSNGGREDYKRYAIQRSSFDSSEIRIYASDFEFSDSLFRIARIDVRGGDGEMLFVRNVVKQSGITSSANAGISFRIPNTRISIINNLFSGEYGSPFFDDFKELEMLSNTFGSAAGIRPSDSGATQLVANNIFAATPRNSQGLGVTGFAEVATLKNNILPETSMSVWDVESGNIIGNPGFYDESNGDFHLLATSPAINAGTNEFVDPSQQLDLDGSPRVVEGVIDIGAYERYLTDLHPADTNGDSSISSDEFNAYNTAWRANDIWPTAPAVITADFVTRAGYLLQKGGDYKNIGVGKPQTWVPVNE